MFGKSVTERTLPRPKPLLGPQPGAPSFILVEGASI